MRKRSLRPWREMMWSCWRLVQSPPWISWAWGMNRTSQTQVQPVFNFCSMGNLAVQNKRPPVSDGLRLVLHLFHAFSFENLTVFSFISRIL
jgi:hypothetical protein